MSRGALRGPAALAGLATAAALALAGCGISDRDPQLRGSTLRATVVDRDGDGALEQGPGEPLVDRTELAPRGRATRELARFGQLTDTHVRDEESPARVPFLDRLGPPVTTAFRPQEALSAQVLVAAIRSMNAERPQGVLVTGDLIDNAQRNELDQFLEVVRGGQVDPNSGGRGYRGVQLASNPDGFFYRPSVDAPQVDELLPRAQRELFSPGLRVPWLPALGNHDLLVQGELPPSPGTQAIATSGEALLTFDPALESLVDRLPEQARRAGGSPDLQDVPPGLVEDLIVEGVPGRRTRVPADPARRFVTAEELVADLRDAAGLPDGPRARLDYAADVAPGVRAIVLDTVARSANDAVLAPEQVRFLRRQLRLAGDRAVVVVDHYGLDRTAGGEPALELIGRDDRVVAELTGDSHRHTIRPVRTRAGGFWRITTSSLADWPQQGRMLRLVDGPDGSRALETWAVDHAGGLGTRDLAGAARSLSFLDAQGGRPNGLRGARTDRNARLWLPPRR